MLTISLPTAKELNGLGFRRQSYFYWQPPVWADSPEHFESHWYMVAPGSTGWMPDVVYAAYTTAELIEWLKERPDFVALTLKVDQGCTATWHTGINHWHWLSGEGNELVEAVARLVVLLLEGDMMKRNQ